MLCNSTVVTRLNAVLEYAAQIKETLPNSAASNLKNWAFIQRLNKMTRAGQLIIFTFKHDSSLLNEKRNIKRGGEWYLEKRGSRKFWQDLEISEPFLISLEVSFLHGLYLPFLSLETFYQRVSGSDF